MEYIYKNFTDGELEKLRLDYEKRIAAKSKFGYLQVVVGLASLFVLSCYSIKLLIIAFKSLVLMDFIYVGIALFAFIKLKRIEKEANGYKAIRDAVNKELTERVFEKYR
jgi:hypothetical protein